MITDEILILKRALERERKSRELAESFVENRLRELYENNIQLSNKVLIQEEFQTDLLDNLVDALFVVDFKGNILKINKEASKLIGLEKDFKLSNISQFSTKNKNKIYELFKKDNFKNKNTTFHYVFVNRNKEKKYVDIKAKILIDSYKKPYAYQAIVRDVTEQYLIDLEIQKLQNFENFESQILKDLLKSNDIFSNAYSLVNYVSKFLNTNDCVFYGIVNNELVELARTDKKLNSNNLSKNKVSIPLNKGVVGRVTRNKKGEIINDTSKDLDYVVDDATRLSEITIPILLDDKVIGIIDSEHPEKNHFTKDQLTSLSKISVLIALHLKNSATELEKSLKQKELEFTKNRLQLIFESYSDAKIIESKDRYIEFVSHAFLNLFNIPIEYRHQLIGLSCEIARENSKGNFVNEDEFVRRVEEIIENEEVVTNEILELKDGRFVSRDYTPIYHNENLDGHMWRYRDVTLQINYDKSIEYQNKKYKNIIDNINLGLMEVDNNDTILTVNNAFCNISGYNSSELIGKKAKEVLLKKQEVEIMNQKNKIREKGIDDIYEIEINTKNGDTKYWLISGAPNYNIKGDVIGSVGIHLDITQLKKLNIENEKLITDLTESNKELYNYAHVVSHDLKTPLRTISSCINWLKEDNAGKLNEESLEYISIILESVNDMDKLISNTLQFSELRASSSITGNKSELQPIVSSIITNLNRDSMGTLEINIVKTLPEVKLNETKAKQIFQNILDNAYKYKDSTKDSFVNINWENQAEFIKFSIEDNGIGIDEEHFHLVFEIFKKLNNRTDSSGIGLSIVKKIVESHGGEIWFDSKLHVGTTFYFTLPK